MRKKAPLFQPEPDTSPVAPSEASVSTSLEREGQGRIRKKRDLKLSKPFVDNLTTTSQDPISFDDLTEQERAILEEKQGPDWQFRIMEAVNRRGRGIKLSRTYRRLINGLLLTLRDQSRETYNYKSPGFYSGVNEAVIFRENDRRGFINTESRTIRTTVYAQAKLYAEGKHPSGAELREVKRMLMALHEDPDYKFYVREPVYSGKSGNSRIVEWRKGYDSLIYIKEYDRLKIDDGEGVLSEYMDIYLHPLLTQFEGGYHSVPENLDELLSGGERQSVQAGDYALFDYLTKVLGALGGKNVFEVNEETLFRTIFPTYHKARKLKRMREELLPRAVESVMRTGLLVSFSKRKGSEGQTVYLFTLNKDYMKSHRGG